MPDSLLTHDQARAMFSSYLDGELGKDDEEKLKAHLAVCTTCRAELESLRRTVKNLSGLRAHAPKNFLANIEAQIYRRSRGRFFGKRWLLFGRVPFEWISLALIIAMLVCYIAAEQAGAR